MCFDIGNFPKRVILLANSKEQICSEKIKSLLKFGITSTRYKDIFDIYYLFHTNNFESKRFLQYLDKLVFKDDLIEENNIVDVKNNLEFIFNDKRFKTMINMAKNNWLEIPIEEVVTSILRFISALELVEV